MFKPLIEKTLRELYEKEPDLFNLDDSKEIERHVGERAIVFRFGLYFQKELDECGGFGDYYLDCEYNRKGLEPKKLKDGLIVPDLILHKRKTNDGNLVVMEFKGDWSRNQQHDEEKIEGMVSKNGVFRYKEGYTILLKKEKGSVKQIFPKSQS